MVIVPSDYTYRLPRYLGSVTSHSFGQNAFSRVFCNQTTLGYQNRLLVLVWRRKSSGLNTRLDFRTRPVWSIIRIRPNMLSDHSSIGNNLLRLYLMVT
ncbi:hypothetical protein HanRHA438_Chr00c56g0859361 [Helianthus annuus]|nr:hypothetical protein HanRHA438_Chr00c56g0859361 [Helianthus annuus]